MNVFAVFLLLLLNPSPTNSFIKRSCMKCCKNSNENQIIVIGAGIGGLATAARLAKAGGKVKVLEKNGIERIGGRLNSRIISGNNENEELKYRFDTGPSLLLLPEVFEQTFSDLGYKIEDFLEIKRVEPSYKIFFGDGTIFEFSHDETEVEKQFEKIESGSYLAFKKYMNFADTNLKVGWPNFIQEKFDANNLKEFLTNCIAFNPLASHHQQMNRLFKSPKIKAILSFQDLYVGLTPYTAPAVFSLLQAIELNKGIFYPIGGFQGISNALFEVCKHLGVEFEFECEVKEISVGGKIYSFEAEGVVAKSEEYFPSKLVVSNVDLPFSELNLLSDQFKRRDVGELEFSSGIIAIYWGCNKTWAQLNHHSIFLSTNYEESWEVGSFFEGPKEKDDAAINFYVAAPSRTDPSACPPNHDSIMVLVPCPLLPSSNEELTSNDKRRLEENVGGWVQRVRKNVVGRISKVPGMEAFESSIVCERINSPLDWKSLYSLERGAAFGLSHKLSQLSVFRPKHDHPSINSLHYVGASTKPGNGLPLVLVGAKILSEKLVETRPEMF